MASIKILKSRKWLVQVRRQGVELSKTFINKTDAEKWGRAKEVEIETGKLTAEIANMPTLKDCLNRYLKTVTIKKRSKDKETYRIERELDGKNWTVFGG